MENPLSRKLFYFFPVFFCFCLPFGSLLLSGIVVCWTVFSLLNIEKDLLVVGFKRPLLWLMFAFFIYTCVSAVFSENHAGALFAVEIKLSFVLFPYLLFCFRYPFDIIKRCIISFVSGCFFACLYLVARAFVFSVNGHPEYFFYTLFSQFIHASYFSMYLVLAIFFVVLLYGQWFRHQKAFRFSSWFFVAFFVAGVFLCSSKMGIITFFVCMPILVLYKQRNRLHARGIMLIISGLILSGAIVVMLFPTSFSRLGTMRKVATGKIDKTSSESTGVRMLVWEQAWMLAKDNFVTGVGSGDANPELYSAYEREGLTGALSHRLNAHNEFLQTFVGMGIGGLILLMALTFGQINRGLRKRHFFLTMFALLVSMHFMVESMLQASAGVLFFVFFLCVFDLVGEKELLAEPEIH
jgi:O-antigen ligase